MQGHQAIRNLKRGGVITAQGRLLQLRTERWRHIRRDGNTADAALGIKPMGRRIFARELHKLWSAGQALR